VRSLSNILIFSRILKIRIERDVKLRRRLRGKLILKGYACTKDCAGIIMYLATERYFAKTRKTFAREGKGREGVRMSRASTSECAWERLYAKM